MKTSFSPLSTDLSFSQDPVVLHGSILGTISTLEYSLLSIGLGLVKIKEDSLFKTLGFKNMSAYVLYLAHITGKDRSSIYKWLQIGELYLKYQEQLGKAGFTGKDGLTKLSYLERALENNPEEEVYHNIVGMTHREFAGYARSVVESEGIEGEKPEEETKEYTDEWGYRFMYREREAVRVHKDIGRRVLKILLPSIRLAFNALDRKGYVVAVHLDTLREYEKYMTVAIEARDKMREEMKEEGRVPQHRITNG